MKGGSPELGLDEPPTKTKSSSKNKCKVKPLATKNGPAGAAASAAAVSKAEHNHGVMTRLVIFIICNAMLKRILGFSLAKNKCPDRSKEAQVSSLQGNYRQTDTPA